MKANKVLLLSLAAFAICANAAPVSVDTAKFAAGSWARSDAALGVRHGDTVSGAETHDVDGTPGFYAVALEGGGTVFLAADDEMGPVLAFTSESNPDLSAKSPLLNLLNRDIAARRRQLEAEATPQVSPSRALLSLARPSSTATSSGSAANKSKKLWAAFTSSSSTSSSTSSGGRAMLGATPRKTLAISEIRVDPILQSQWSQQEARGRYCYNYYTPNHYPCGCTATAAGQILYRWQWPTEELPKFSALCNVGGADQTLWSHGETRLYDWSAMVPVPDSGISEEGRQAIGALLYDLGVSFKSEYASDGTGALDLDVASSLHTHFKYASACTYTVNGTSAMSSRTSALHEAPTRQRAILANLDAKRPVELYISSAAAGGHAVVADGYGYVTIDDEEVEFTHINMGWAGTDDMWYNLPVISTQEAGAQAGQSGGFVFDFIMGATFNIHPTETGDILSGRVVDDGDPVEGATVEVREAGMSSVLATTTTDEHGIYSFTLPGGKNYNVTATTADGKKSGTADDVQLQATTIPGPSYTSNDAGNIGNSWGNDIDVVIPYVRIGTTLYPNLNTALDAAAEMDDPVVEIFGPTRLKRHMTIATNVTICVDGDVNECTVAVDDRAFAGSAWSLLIAEGARVAFSNVVFVSEVDTPLCLNVMAGGTAAFTGVIDIGIVEVANVSGFEVAGALRSPITVKCKATSGSGVTFGKVTCTQAEIGDSAAMLCNYYDEEVGGIATFSGGAGFVKWGDAPVPPETAVASLYQNGETSYYRSLRQLFNAVTADGVATLFRDASFTNAVTLSHKLTFRSDVDAESPYTVSAGSKAGFTIASGGSLTLQSVTLDRPDGKGVALATVAGGALTLDDGATLSGIKVKKGEYAPVKVTSGSVTMNSGSAIEGCDSSEESVTKCAGAIYLAGSGCSLTMKGGSSITGCHAKVKTGAVFVGSGASVTISGKDCRVTDNAATDSNQPGNLYFTGTSPLLKIAGPMSGAVGVRYSASAQNVAGGRFADVASSVGEDGVLDMLGSFANDEKPDLYAAAASGFTGLEWSVNPPLPRPVPQADAVARLIMGSTTNFYASLEDALTVAGSGTARIELLRDDEITAPLEISGKITIAGGGHVVTRASGEVTVSIASGASLAVGNVDFDATAEDAKKLFLVEEGGSFTMNSGAVIRNVTGAGSRAEGAVAVQGGTFTMNSGAVIRDCVNSYRNPGNGTGCGGGVLVDGGKAYFNGGTVTGCSAYRGGGVYIANHSEVYVKGDVDITGNTTLDGEDSNLMVADQESRLVLTGPLTGKVGYYEGWQASTEVFGEVSASFSGTDDELVDSARNFIHDTNGDFGAVGVAGSEKLLIWNDAFDAGSCDVEGKVYEYLDGGTAVEVPDPEVRVGLVYNAEAQEGVVVAPYFTLVDGVKTNAGSYTAVATLRGGCVWSDGSSDPKELAWSIAPAPVTVRADDASKVYGTDDPAEFTYKVEGLLGEDKAEDVFAGKLDRAPGEAVGTYEIRKGTLKPNGNYEMTFESGTFEISAILVPVPLAVNGLVYKGVKQTGVKPSETYGDYCTLSGETATDAGEYVATAALIQPGRAWSDGTTGPKTIQWSIGKARLVVRADDKYKKQGDADPALTFTVDDTYGLVGGDTKDKVFSGALSRVPGEELGEYEILKGTLEANGNYELIFVHKTAKLTIGEADAPEVVECAPFAFTAIGLQTNGTWRLVLDPGVKYCKYTLYATDELGGAWTQVGDTVTLDADGEFEFSAEATGDRRFWKVVGEDGEKPAGE